MINRRKFLHQAGALTTGALLGSNALLNAMPRANRYKIGLQLYTLRDPMGQDVKGTLRKVSSLGYEEVETYGYNWGKNHQYLGYTPKEFKQILDDNHLTTSSGHYDLDKFILPGVTDDDLKRYVDQCIEAASVLKQETIVWPWLDPQFYSIDGFKKVAQKLNEIGERTKKANLQVAYHNHNFEFIDHDGQIGYNIILDETDAALVKLEMDLYWVSHSSPLKPHEWFQKYPGRFVAWHLKDMDKVNRDLHTEMGNGTIDFKSILPDARLAGVKHVFVEQGNNLKADPFESVGQSIAYVKRELIKNGTL